MASRRLMSLVLVLAVAPFANAYVFQGLDIIVDYWAGSGSNETIIVIDWNESYGPYITESHTWGFRWDGSENLGNALNAIDAVGALNIDISAEGFINDAFYQDLSIDNDNHNSAPDGWFWLADAIDGGATWTTNLGGVYDEILGNSKIEGLNCNVLDWTGDNITIPIVPEPTTIALFGFGGLLLRKRRV